MNRWTKLKLKLTLSYLRFMAKASYFFKAKRALMAESRANKICVQLEINAILVKQFEDASRKQKKSFHWGDIGWQVENAATACEVILRSPESEDLDQYFGRVLPAISELVSSYRQSNLDESGYALGTVREIERALIEKSQHL